MGGRNEALRKAKCARKARGGQGCGSTEHRRTKTTYGKNATVTPGTLYANYK